MTSIITTITYDFFYNADSNAWFCSYSAVVMKDNKVLTSEFLQSGDEIEFERLRKNAIESGFEKDHEYFNEETGVRGETYRKVYGFE